MNEVWKDVVGYEGLYQVSSLGRVKNVRTDRIMKACEDKNGYLIIRLSLKGKSKAQKVHRLVCLTFLPNPENKPEVNHTNGIKSDNSLLNLEWATRSENNKHAYDTGLNNVKRKYKQIKGINLQTLQEVVFESRLAAEQFTNCSAKNITFICQGKRKSFKNWTFQYLTEAA